MNKSVFILLSVLLVSIFPVLAQETENAGITPDSFLWGLDRALDRISLALTFDKAKKAEKGLKIAQERLLEVRNMIEENKLEAAEKAREEHGKSLTRAKQNIADIRKDNVEDELESIIQVETELEEYEERVEKTSDELRIKIKIEGRITEEQQKLVDSILNTIKEQTGDVKVEVKGKRNDLKIRIRERTGESESEVEAKIKNIEKRKGLSDIKKVRAQEKINEAIEDIEELREEIADKNIKDRSITRLLEEAESKLENAQSAFREEDFGEAFGQATAAINLTKNVEKQLESREEAEEDEEEREIEVKIENGRARVKIEVNDTKLRFVLDTDNRDEIINEIISRTGLTREDIDKIIEFEEELEESATREDRSKARVSKRTEGSNEVEIEEETESEESESIESNSEMEEETNTNRARESRRSY